MKNSTRQVPQRFFLEMLLVCFGASWRESYLIGRALIRIRYRDVFGYDDGDIDRIKNQLPRNGRFSLKTRLLWALACLIEEKPLYMSVVTLGILFSLVSMLIRIVK